MNQSTTMYVGLDVHKDSIDIALAEAPRDNEVRHLGTVAGGLAAVSKAMRRLVSAGHRLHIVYEAGPCGFVLQRHFAGLGWRCDVVAPSAIPRPAGERVKTDRRDAMKLARLARVGELTAVRVPDAADEAVRDVVRAREDAVREQRNARHRLKALLLRNGVAYAGKSAWTAAHLRWLATVKMEHAAQQIAFQEYLHAVTESGARIARLEQALREALPTWNLGGITKRGDNYLRSLLIQGAKSAVMSAHKRSDPISQWAAALRDRIGWQKAAVALANKNARILWAVMTKGEAFDARHVSVKPGAPTTPAATAA